MRIDRLDGAQLELFSTNATVISTCFGGRKFKAEIEVDGKKQKIIASAKEVYRHIEKTHRREIFNQFHSIEIKTRDKGVFSKQLNLLQKIYFFIVKALFGLNFKDTWENKFIFDRRQIDEAVDGNFDSIGNKSTMRERSVAKKIQNAFKVFNGESCDLVFVDVCAGRGLGFGVGLTTIENPMGLFYYDKPDHDISSNSRTRMEFFKKEVFNNPKALIISLAYAPGHDDYQDRTIPKGITCGVYHMGRKEFDALPRISRKLRKFMNDRIALSDYSV